MSRYRIAPYGVDEWKIQKRWLGFLWIDVLWLVGYDTYDHLRFARKEQAMKWIDGTIELSELRWQRNLESKARAKAVKPESYPESSTPAEGG